MSTIVLKMGYGGSELAKKVPNYIRARAKKNKLILISNERDKLGSFAQSLFSLKRPVAYTGKGIKYKDQLVFLKKRKQQQKSK